ncbi:MAG: radical SAM protein [Selenomonadaceae bacterium]|nr:radical SAM protein [Selenomonadaceae bacterium]
MNVAILGRTQKSQMLAKIIEDGYNPWLERKFNKIPLNVVAYVSKNLNPSVIGDKAVLSMEQFAALYNKKLIDKIIFPREVYEAQNRMVFSTLRRLGVKVEDVCITQRLQDEISLTSFIEPYFSAKYLPYLEFHVADHCNLNCKACEHYSGLVKKPHFPNLQNFTRDFERLHEFIDDIYMIRILGGEPLLNPELNEYIKLSRRLYPQAQIYVVTNGILLPKMPESFFETLRRYNAAIAISFYPPLESKMPAIKHLLEEKRVMFGFTPLYRTFTIKQTLNPHDQPKEIFLQCLQATCHNLYEGKIASCFLPFTTKYFNAYYDKNLPEDGALDLYDPNLTTEKLKAHLLTPFERCRYCTTPVEIEWSTIKNPAPITDWAIVGNREQGTGIR